MKEWTSAYLAVNGIRLHYHRTNGSGPCLLLLHGITDDGLCWTRLVRDLAPGWDCILLDARGHGHSAAPDGGYGPSDHAGDVLGLVEVLSLQRPVLMGHSMGAGTAALAASMHPDRIRALVLEDPPWREPPLSDAQRRALAQEYRSGLRAEQALPLQQLVARYQRDFPHWHWDDIVPCARAKHLVRQRAFRYYDSPAPPWREVARNLSLPTLLFTADPAKGALVTPATARQAAALAPDLRVVHLPGAGHDIRRDEYAAFLEGLRAFLAQVA